MNTFELSFLPGQGQALYIPPGWIFVERITSDMHWVGLRAGCCITSLQISSDLTWLSQSWAKDDPVVLAFMKVTHEILHSLPSTPVKVEMLDDATEAGVEAARLAEAEAKKLDQAQMLEGAAQGKAKEAEEAKKLQEEAARQAKEAEEAKKLQEESARQAKEAEEAKREESARQAKEAEEAKTLAKEAARKEKEAELQLKKDEAAKKLKEKAESDRSKKA